MCLELVDQAGIGYPDGIVHMALQCSQCPARFRNSIGFVWTLDKVAPRPPSLSHTHTNTLAVACPIPIPAA